MEAIMDSMHSMAHKTHSSTPEEVLTGNITLPYHQTTAQLNSQGWETPQFIYNSRL